MTQSAENEVATSRIWAGALLVAFGVAVAANGVVGVVRGSDTDPVNIVFVLVLLALTSSVARGLRGGNRWARPAGIAVSIVGLFFLAPIVGTMLLGGGTEPVGTGWDVWYFPLMTVLLLSALAMLIRDRRDASHSAEDR